MEAILDKPCVKTMPIIGQADRKYSGQVSARTCVFIDNSMLFHAIRCLYPPGSKYHRHRRLDYIKFKEALGGDDVRFYYNTLPQPDTITDLAGYRAWERNNKFVEGVRKLGYNMIGLPTRDRIILTETGIQHSYKECCLDSEIIYDMAVLSREGKYDSFTLVASDDVYARAINRIRHETKVAVTVAFFGQVGCSAQLLKEASHCCDLGLDLDAIFRPYKTSQV
jgi:hypothetical protein